MVRSDNLMEDISILVDEGMIERKAIVPYMAMSDKLINDFGNVLKASPNQEFFKMIAEYMNGYMQRGEKPPEEIASAIFNLVDDMGTGRELTLKAGDYIALQNYLRKNRK
jgi:hypothetical protein